MIDYFALALTHGLFALALLRIVRRPELDREDLGSEAPREPAPGAAGSRRERSKRRDA